MLTSTMQIIRLVKILYPLSYEFLPFKGSNPAPSVQKLSCPPSVNVLCKEFLCRLLFSSKKFGRLFKAFTFLPHWGELLGLIGRWKQRQRTGFIRLGNLFFWNAHLSLFIQKPFCCPSLQIYSPVGVGFRESRSLHFYSSRKRGPHTKEQPRLGLSRADVFSFPGPFY